VHIGLGAIFPEAGTRFPDLAMPPEVAFERDLHTYGLRIPANRRAAHNPPGLVRYTTAQPAYLRESAIPRGFTRAPQSLP
jgi:hypothetical protein